MSEAERSRNHFLPYGKKARTYVRAGEHEVFGSRGMTKLRQTDKMLLTINRTRNSQRRSLRRFAPWFCSTHSVPQNFDFAQDDRLIVCLCFPVCCRPATRPHLRLPPRGGSRRRSGGGECGGKNFTLLQIFLPLRVISPVGDGALDVPFG